ncbi:PITH domain-containing protein 1 [Intoshia linei]|uniref:PITH domain-containing protein 1 n=1 Tax=Intoshia linei TaxID=1819745 RepID=A0A177AWE1_9BILA|nr:PITH domain-containing protein 1 [Intoshia linei]
MTKHDHNHGHSCSHDVIEESIFNGKTYTLHKNVEFEHLLCLNETTEDSGKFILKDWDKRFDGDEYLESYADEELIIRIPFGQSVNIKNLIIMGVDEESHPSAIQLYKNKALTFNDTRLKCDQSFNLICDTKGLVEYPVKGYKFSNLRMFTIFIPKSFSGGNTKIKYIGLKGEVSKVQPSKQGIIVYESRANPVDHKTNLINSNVKTIM